jgi:hypothetical protein
MEAVITSETSANLYETTRRNIPEDSHLHNRHLNLNLKSHCMLFLKNGVNIFLLWNYHKVCVNVEVNSKDNSKLLNSIFLSVSDDGEEVTLMYSKHEVSI